MSEALNYMLWTGFIFALPVISGIIYLHCCKIGYFDDDQESREESEEKGETTK